MSSLKNTDNLTEEAQRTSPGISQIMDLDVAPSQIIGNSDFTQFTGPIFLSGSNEQSSNELQISSPRQDSDEQIEVVKAGARNVIELVQAGAEEVIEVLKPRKSQIPRPIGRVSPSGLSESSMSLSRSGTTSQIGINSRIPRLVVRLAPSGSNPVKDQLTSRNENNTAAPKSLGGAGGKKKNPVPGEAGYRGYRARNNVSARKSYAKSKNEKAEKIAGLLKENEELKNRLKVANRKIEDLKKKMANCTC